MDNPDQTDPPGACVGWLQFCNGSAWVINVILPETRESPWEKGGDPEIGPGPEYLRISPKKTYICWSASAKASLPVYKRLQTFLNVCRRVQG